MSNGRDFALIKRVNLLSFLPRATVLLPYAALTGCAITICCPTFLRAAKVNVNGSVGVSHDESRGPARADIPG